MKLLQQLLSDSETRVGVLSSRRPPDRGVLLSRNCMDMTPAEGHMAIHMRGREFTYRAGGAAAAP
jgi:hypothetical protein